MCPVRAGLERAFGRPVIFAECFAYPRFGIEEYPSADDGIGNLPRVAQGPQCSGGDMQVSAHLLPGQAAFSHDRGAVAVQRPASVLLRPTRGYRTVVIFCAFISFRILHEDWVPQFRERTKVYFPVQRHYREFVTAQYAGRFFIDFQLVILQHADDISAVSYSCDHSSRICFASASIRKLSAFSWRV